MPGFAPLAAAPLGTARTEPRTRDARAEGALGFAGRVGGESRVASAAYLSLPLSGRAEGRCGGDAEIAVALLPLGAALCRASVQARSAGECAFDGALAGRNASILRLRAGVLEPRGTASAGLAARAQVAGAAQLQLRSGALSAIVARSDAAEADGGDGVVPPSIALAGLACGALPLGVTGAGDIAPGVEAMAQAALSAQVHGLWGLAGSTGARGSIVAGLQRALLLTGSASGNSLQPAFPAARGELGVGGGAGARAAPVVQALGSVDLGAVATARARLSAAARSTVVLARAFAGDVGIVSDGARAISLSGEAQAHTRLHGAGRRRDIALTGRSSGALSIGVAAQPRMVITPQAAAAVLSAGSANRRHHIETRSSGTVSLRAAFHTSAPITGDGTLQLASLGRSAGGVSFAGQSSANILLRTGSDRALMLAAEAAARSAQVARAQGHLPLAPASIGRLGISGVAARALVVSGHAETALSSQAGARGAIALAGLAQIQNRGAAELRHAQWPLQGAGTVVAVVRAELAAPLSLHVAATGAIGLHARAHALAALAGRARLRLPCQAEAHGELPLALEAARASAMHLGLVQVALDPDGAAFGQGRVAARLVDPPISITGRVLATRAPLSMRRLASPNAPQGGQVFSSLRKGQLLKG